MTRRFSTADLETLTEGTTPGPWYTEDDGYGGFILLGSDPDRPYVYPHIGDMEEEADAKFVAAAPALAADYHRVRTELEVWLAGVEEDLAEEHVTSHADLDAAVGAWSAHTHGELGETLNTRDHLKAILNGDTE